MKKMISLALFLFAAVALAPGCAEYTQQKAIEAASSVVSSMGKAADEGMKNGVRDFMAQAGLQAINPKGKFKGSVLYVQGFIFEGDYGVEGVSGQVQMSAASGRDTVSEEAPQ